MSSTMTDEIETNSGVFAVAFATNGECLVSGGNDGVQMWRAKNGTKMTTLTAKKTYCLAVSKDGRWIAAGTLFGDVFVWNAETYQDIFSQKEIGTIIGVDFSPDSTRVLTASGNGTACVWDVATRQRLLSPLGHCDLNHVRAVKYSPSGDQIAISTSGSVRVYDGHDGRLLIEIPMGVCSSYNTGLLWSKVQLFVLSKEKIQQIEASTGSTSSEWPLPDTNGHSCIALPQHDKFIACSTKRTLSFWDTSTHTQLGLIQHSEDIHSITFSPDNRIVAIGGGKKITMHSLSHITLSIPLPGLHPPFQEPDIRLANSETLLPAAIPTSQSPSYHVLASQALVRTRLRQWDAAIVDAEQSIKIQPSVIAYIAKSVALVGKGERDKGYRTCDIALVRFHPAHIRFLLLIKAVIVFMAGDHQDAISRIDDLIATIHSNTLCYVVQACMHFLLGKSQMEHSDYESAMHSFERARVQMRHYDSRALVLISLISGWKFDDLDIAIGQGLCEVLYAAGRIKEGIKYFLDISRTFNKEFSMSKPVIEWASDFKLRCCKALEDLGDTAMFTQRHDDAIVHYSSALSLNPEIPHGLFIKRGKARMAQGFCDDALTDVNEAIARDPSSPWGYEAQHEVLHAVKRYTDAVVAFETMFSKMAQSPDPNIRERREQYISPQKIRAKIWKIVQRTIRRSPRVLISTSTGRLQSRVEQAAAFESSPVFSELLSSMTRRIDRARVKHEVKQFFRYVMLSHKWEDNEPIFQQVIHIAVYDLDKSPTHDKLQMFCRLVRDAGFNWAWSDTCCIDKQDHFVLQEALVAMFKWYRGSAFVVVYLRGVRSPAKLGDLVGSIWNTRAWTFQEYVAGKVVRFYAEDWKLYLDLEIPNHKESPEIILEMEQATGVSAERLMALRPGLNNIREKLCLASTRETTLVEDAAYSLLGIFSVTGVPAIYGEGESALGRLLAHILPGSGDVSILAWTGQSSSVNSCLPARITVYSRPATLHLPLRIEAADMAIAITTLRRSTLDIKLSLQLYDRLNELPTPWFVGSRMKLPCLAFKLAPFSPHQTHSGRIYHVETAVFGAVEIKTRRDISRLNGLYLVHPWLDALLGREEMHVGAFAEDGVAERSLLGADDEDSDDEDVEDYFSTPPEPHLPLPLTPNEDTVPMDKETRALQLMARLRQSFGALLFMLDPTNGREEYRRIVAESLITVQIQENVSLGELVESVHILDVL